MKQTKKSIGNKMKPYLYHTIITDLVTGELQH